MTRVAWSGSKKYSVKRRQDTQPSLNSLDRISLPCRNVSSQSQNDALQPSEIEQMMRKGMRCRDQMFQRPVVPGSAAPLFGFECMIVV